MKNKYLTIDLSSTKSIEFFKFDDGDGNYYEDFSKEYSKPGETLEQFIERNI